MEFPAPVSHNAHGARRQFSRRNSIISPQGFGVLLTGAVFGGDLQRRGCSRRGFDVRPGDPLSFSAAATVLLAVTLVAGYIPVRRAMRVDPMVALRYE
ncbi:MAG: hypothetical protein DMG10_12650 [Acidobacteria bacterium]|nr:MAG: hypothetical protein DMG10_12650 [Acidobacteriota bacterium]